MEQTEWVENLIVGQADVIKQAKNSDSVSVLGLCSQYQHLTVLVIVSNSVLHFGNTVLSHSLIINILSISIICLKSYLDEPFQADFSWIEAATLDDREQNLS